MTVPPTDEAAAALRPGTRICAPSPTLVAEWDLLARRTGASPFVGPGWVLGWYAAFGTRTGGPLRLVVDVDESGRLCGVLPVVGRLGVCSSPTNWHTPEFAATAEDEATTDRLLATAIAAGRVRLQLSFVDEALGRRAHEVARRLGRGSGERVVQQSRYVPAPGPGTPTPTEALSSDKRKKTRRWRRQLDALGGLQLQVHEDLDGDALERFLQVEDSGWKRGNGTSILAEPRAEQYYRRTARWAAERGMLRITLLTLDDRVLAADLAVEDEEAHQVLKTGFDETMAQYRPGHLLRLDTLERAHAAGLRYEFLGSDAEWKRRWTPHVHTRLRVNVYGPGLVGRFARVAEERLRPRVRDLVVRARGLRDRSGGEAAGPSTD